MSLCYQEAVAAIDLDQLRSIFCEDELQIDGLACFRSPHERLSSGYDNHSERSDCSETRCLPTQEEVVLNSLPYIYIHIDLSAIHIILAISSRLLRTVAIVPLRCQRCIPDLIPVAQAMELLGDIMSPLRGDVEGSRGHKHHRNAMLLDDVPGVGHKPTSSISSKRVAVTQRYPGFAATKWLRRLSFNSIEQFADDCMCMWHFKSKRVSTESQMILLLQDDLNLMFLAFEEGLHMM